MMRETKFLRLLLAMLLLAVALGCGLLYPASLESARNFPDLADLRLPIYFAVLVGFIPVVVAVKLAFDFLGVIDRGDPLSAHTVQILWRMKLLIGIFIGYLVLFLVGFWVATSLMHPTLFVTWLVVEVAALLLFTVVAKFERIFVAALELRQNNKLMAISAILQRGDMRGHLIAACVACLISVVLSTGLLLLLYF